MKRVWADAFVEDANLANNISALRKVLGERDGDGEYIETVPRRGYRFLAEVTTISGDEPPESARPTPVSDYGHTARSRRRWWRMGGAALSLVVVTIAIAVTMRRGEPPRSNFPVVRFTIAPPPGASLATPPQPLAPAISPDGKRIVFRVMHTGGPLLAIRAIDDEVDARILPGTEGARFPFWSPDSRVVSFFADGKLKRINA